MDSSDDEHSNFRDANDFFSFEGDTRDPFKLSFSRTYKNLKMGDPPAKGCENESEFQQQVEAHMVPFVQTLLKKGEETHNKLINSTIGTQAPLIYIYIAYML
jgi:hypothetical protein